MTVLTQPDTETILLVFRLEGEAFGVPVSIVHEILDSQEPTAVPNAPPFVPGLINVRGSVVPVTDVRLRLGMGTAQNSDAARDIVLEHEVKGISTKLAFKADSVEEVHEVNLNDLEPVPDLGTSWPQAFLKGAVRREDDLVIVLDTDALFVPDLSP